MSTQNPSQRTAAALFGRVRSSILALLFSHSGESFYLRQIVRLIGAGHGAVQRELGHLLKAGIIIRKHQGREIYYQANQESPAFPELRGLIIKTAGVSDVLRAALAPIAARISIAFVFGSIARGTENASSDIDIMVIGEVSLREVAAALRPAQDQLHREVNPSVFALDEARRRISSGDHFFRTLMEDERIVLIGDDNELREMG